MSRRLVSERSGTLVDCLCPKTIDFPCSVPSAPSLLMSGNKAKCLYSWNQWKSMKLIGIEWNKVKRENLWLNSSTIKGHCKTIETQYDWLEKSHRSRAQSLLIDLTSGTLLSNFDIRRWMRSITTLSATCQTPKPAVIACQRSLLIGGPHSTTGPLPVPDMSIPVWSAHHNYSIDMRRYNSHQVVFEPQCC